MFDKLKKRRCYLVEGYEGVFLRLLNSNEGGRVREMADGLRDKLALAISLVNEDGSQAFPKQPEETDEAYARRFAAEAVDFDFEAEKAVTETYTKLVKGQPKSAGGEVSLEDIAKN